MDRWILFFLGRSIAFLERRQIDRWMSRTSQSGPVSPRGKTEGGSCTKDKRPSQLDFAQPCVQNLRPLKTGGPVPAHRLHPHGLGPVWGNGVFLVSASFGTWLWWYYVADFMLNSWSDVWWESEILWTNVSLLAALPVSSVSHSICSLKLFDCGSMFYMYFVDHVLLIIMQINYHQNNGL